MGHQLDKDGEVERTGSRSAGSREQSLAPPTQASKERPSGVLVTGEGRRLGAGARRAPPTQGPVSIWLSAGTCTDGSAATSSFYLGVTLCGVQDEDGDLWLLLCLRLQSDTTHLNVEAVTASFLAQAGLPSAQEGCRWPHRG